MSARYPKPWYRPSRKIWVVTLDGKQVTLGPDRDEAFRRYHRLMSERREKPIPATRNLLGVLDSYLDWCQKHRAPETYRWYLDRLQLFSKTVPEGMTSDELRPYHVQEWVDSIEGIANGTRRNHIRAVKRAMKWAEEQGYIDRSPIAHMKKPAGGRREVVISDAEYRAILEVTRDELFRNLLTVSWETGCRPQESLHVEARHVDLMHARWVFPVLESKTKKAPRVVYLNARALEITTELAAKNPKGPIFRNTCGKPWTTDAINCRFTTLARKLGKRYCLYHFRHTWMNRALMSGVDALTVAILAGHTDPSTLAKTYQHLSQDPQYLKRIVERLDRAS